MLTWGKRRFTVEHFFRAAKSEFSLGQFGQRTALGVHRFLVLSLLAYLLAHWVGVEGRGSWREARYAGGASFEVFNLAPHHETAVRFLGAGRYYLPRV
jgi:hypothetical protein